MKNESRNTEGLLHPAGPFNSNQNLQARTRRLLTFLIASVIAGYASIGTARAQEDETYREGKQLASAAEGISAAYSGIRSAYDIEAAVLNFLSGANPSNNNAQITDLANKVDNLIQGGDWKLREALLSHNIGDIMGDVGALQQAADRCKRSAPQGSALSQILWCQSNGIFPVPYPSPKGDAGDLDLNSIQQISGIVGQTIGGSFEKNEEGLKAFFSAPYNDNELSGMKFLGYSINEIDRLPGENTPLENNYIYDWRLGIPAVLQILSYRLQIIAAIDPNFRFDGIYQNELVGYRDVLIEHYNQMLQGVRCATKVEYYTTKIQCADIYTGLSIGAYRYETSSTALLSTYTKFWNQKVGNSWELSNLSDTELLTYAKSALMSRMPLFELKAMINTLYLYTRQPIYDLTQLNQRIPSAASPHLCLERSGIQRPPNSPIEGAISFLNTCDSHNASQYWIYDRQSSTIKNPFAQSVSEGGTGQCLGLTMGTGSGASHAVQQGWYVGMYDCMGYDSQKWTYDPETKVLLNGWGGTVLDIQWDVLQSGALVWSWPLNYSSAQLWQADEPTRFPCTTCFP